MIDQISNPVDKVFNYLNRLDAAIFQVNSLIKMEEEKCKGGHKIDGKTPMLEDIQLDGRTCDCQRMVYYTEECGCPSGAKHLELKGKPNE